MNEAQCDEIMKQMRSDIDDHELRLRCLEKVSAGREEQVKTLYENVGAIKALVAQLDTKMDAMMNNIESKLQKALDDIDKRLKKLETADGEKWKQAVWIVFALVVGGAFGKMLGG